MTSAKAWYWMALGVLVLSLGTSNTARCWADKASEVLGRVYTRSTSYVAVAKILLGNSSTGEARLQDQLARAQAAQDRIRAQQDMAQARLDEAQALVEEKLIRKQELIISKAMRTDRAGRALQVVRGEHFVDGYRSAVCPSQVEVEVPNIQIPEVPSMEVMPEVPRDPI